MHRPLPLAVLLLASLAGCAKHAGPALPHSEQALADWARSELDLRTWRSCSRSAEEVDLEQAVLVFEVAAEGAVSPLVLEPLDMASDPAMICLAMELRNAPSTVPNDGTARTVRLRAGLLHEVPSAGS